MTAEFGRAGPTIEYSRAYNPFDIQGKRYYSFKRGNAESFALDSRHKTP
jgi:hypothetical protein